ncbi:MAG: ATP-binding protein [Planctomycetota bacterium]
MAEKKPSFRRRSLHVVIVLLVFYPIGVYIYSQSVNRATTQEIVMKNIDAGLTYCLEVKAATEDLLAAPEDAGLQRYDVLRRYLDDPDHTVLERRLRRLSYTSGLAEALVRFTEFYEGDRCFLRWGDDRPERIIAHVEADYPIDRAAIVGRLYTATAGGSIDGTCTASVPLDLGDGKPRRIVVGLVSLNIGSQLGALSEKLSFRALRLSLVGTSLLALLAAYIVYLNDRTRELQLKLEEEKRLAYVGTIAAGMAHEIRNPLSSVKMNIQMIEDKLSDRDDERDDYLVNKVGRIHRETARLEEAVNNFLAFARPKPLDRRWADLNGAVDHVVEFLEPACRQDGIRIVRDYTNDLPEAYIDPEQLGQAVENLLRNAYQAIGRDGIIEVFTGRHGSHLEVRVSDDGPGVPPESRDKVFEIFYTTKEGGSGLGLTIVKQIAEAHGGGIAFETVKDRGAAFTIYLPIDEEA